MDCLGVQSDIPAYHSGDLTAERAAEVGHHLAGCAGCMIDARDALALLALLKSIEEVSPSDAVWSRLEREIGTVRKPRRVLPFLGLMRIAVAASLLVAALSFVFALAALRPGPAATVAMVAPDGAGLAPGHRVAVGEVFQAPTYVVLALPDVGTLKLHRGTEIRFESARRVRLVRGDLFAEVQKGFAVESADATVTVRGTRFGVRRDDRPSTVYVVEGSVDVDTAAGRLQVEGGRMAVVGGGEAPLQDEALEWIAPYERTMLTLETGTAPAIRPGDVQTWRLAFRTTSPAPLAIEPFRELPSHLYLRIVNPDGKEYVTLLEGSTLEAEEVRPGPGGLTRLDVLTPCLLRVRVGTTHFSAPGRYRVTMAYQGRQGAFQSVPAEIEVR